MSDADSSESEFDPGGCCVGCDKPYYGWRWGFPVCEACLIKQEYGIQCWKDKLISDRRQEQEAKLAKMNSRQRRNLRNSYYSQVLNKGYYGGQNNKGNDNGGYKGNGGYNKGCYNNNGGYKGNGKEYTSNGGYNDNMGGYSGGYNGKGNDNLSNDNLSKGNDNLSNDGFGMFYTAGASSSSSSSSSSSTGIRRWQI